ncbi:pyridoxal-dependent decarboxylase [Robiginitalea sp. SC105]|uniref:pyridoxal phosphate-dependent decarboxylase family protein n=1 Tax=Robiginitalea sp. SC105 TaxID=2762332 RepID=UPI00163B194B|nr:pyridoxal-dependent decarboxylase [Robiginitalea sp. SC105]MBC2839417.1 pyridoxal-dependent decarboxylase [Robiginitalea sp. SC105]
MAQSLLEKAYDPEAFRQLGKGLIDTLANHLQSVQQGRGNVLDYREPADELTFWTNFPDTADFGAWTTAVLRHTTHVHHPRCMGHQVAPPLPLASLAALLGELLNNGMAIYEMGMAPTAMERQLTDWLCRRAGFGAEARGFLTSGGTLANLTALLAARRARGRTDVWNEGYSGKQAILVGEAAHYCVDRAARIMGLGDAGVLKVPVGPDNSMLAGELPRIYEKALADGLEPIALVGSAPSTATGSYDPLDELADFCEPLNLWLHVDGAHGGPAILSDKYGGLMRGIHRADSLVIDGHKMMGLPVLTTALLFRDGGVSYTTFSQQADYLLTESREEDWYNLAKRTFECTKLTSVFCWHAVINQYGESIFPAYLDRQYDLAREFAGMLRERPGWELALTPQSNIVCFRRTPTGAEREACNALNERIRRRLLEDGKFYIVQTRLDGLTYLRTSLMNPFTTRAHLSELLELLESYGAG